MIVLDLAAHGQQPDVARGVIQATDGYHHRVAFSGSASSDPVRAEELLLLGRGQADLFRSVVARAEIDIERTVAASPEYAATRADEPNFLDGEPEVILTTEHVIVG